MGADGWIKLYSALLYLYPRAFRQAFGKEMRYVFAEVLRDSRRRGSLGLLRFALREFGELPYSVLREQASPLYKAGLMLFSRRPLWTAIMGYALGFMLMRLPHALTPILPWMGFWLGIPAYFLIIFLSGWIGGTLLGFSIRREGSRWFGLMGGLSQLVCYFVINRLLTLWIGDRVTTTSITEVLAVLLWPGLNGLLIGGLLGSFRENARYILRFAGFGTIGFVLGYLADRLVAALMQSYLLDPAYNPIPELAGLWSVLFWLVPQLIYGAVIGLSLGLANRKARMLRTPLAV